MVGNIDDEYAQQAKADDFNVLSIATATASADICLILLSDEVIPEVFASEIAPNLKPGAAIVFASGYTLAYGLITPPEEIDVLLLAPRMAGENARQRFLDQQGFYAYIWVEADVMANQRVIVDDAVLRPADGLSPTSLRTNPIDPAEHARIVSTIAPIMRKRWFH